MSTVSIQKCETYNVDKIQSSIKQSLKDINFTIKPRSKVLIKPNILNKTLPERCAVTNPAVIDAVCQILKQKHCKILIGESSGSPLGKGGTREAFNTSGIAEVAEKYKAKIVVFEAEPLNHKKIEGTILKEITYAKILDQVDLIINIPKLKTHTYTYYTGAIKNTFGFIPGGLKIQYHAMCPTVNDFSNLLVDIYQNLTPGLNIMDAIQGMEGSGPSAGTPKHAGLILTSENAVALDIIAQQIIDVLKEHQVVTEIAKRRNLVKDIKVIGHIPKIPFKRPIDIIGKLPGFLRNFAESQMAHKPVVNKALCTKCGTCQKICPRGAITMQIYPVYNYKKCIRCYCCHELCPYHAIYLKRKLAVKILKKLSSIRKLVGFMVQLL